MAQPQGGGRRGPLRLCRAPAEPPELVPRRAGRRRRHRPQLDLLSRDRRRGPQHAVLRGRPERAHLGQLVRRVLPEDDHPDHDLGHRRADLRRSPGGPGLPARHRHCPRGLRARLERPLHDRADRAGRLLPARRGVQRADRPLRRARPGPPRRRAQRVRERDRDRPGDRDDDRRRPPRRVDASRTARTASRRRRSAAGASASHGSSPSRRRTPWADSKRERAPDGPPALRRQPVLRRQPHVGGEGARPGDALPVARRRDRRPRCGLRRRCAHVHVHDARPDRVDLRSRAGATRSLRGSRVLSVHAVRPQVRERGHRGRHARRAQAIPARRGASRRRDPRRLLDGQEGHRGRRRRC